MFDGTRRQSEFGNFHSTTEAKKAAGAVPTGIPGTRMAARAIR